MMLATAPTELVWQAQPKQAAYLRDFAGVFELLYGGAAGSGKSDTLLIYQIRRRMRWPGTSGLFLRRTYPELSHAEGAIPRSHELLSGTGAVWNGSERKWKFPGGGVLEFGHLQRDEDKYNYQSSAYADIAFDELTAFLLSQYLYMFSRARSTIPGCYARIRSATNPGNVGHTWVKERFIDSQPSLTVGWFKRQDDRDVPCGPDDPKARSRAFVPALIRDNRYLADTDYQVTLEAMAESDRRALLEGDWDAWAGMVFKEFKRETHTLKPFAIPTDWPRVTGLDWGTARPFVCLWLATGPRLESDPEPNRPCDSEHRYVYRELSQRGLRDEQMATQVATMSMGEKIRAHHADPESFWSKAFATGYRVADVFARAGVQLSPANNARILGKRAVERQIARCSCGVPRLRVFETCTELIRTLPSLPYDRHNVEDVDTDAEDDQYDALRYALMGPTAATSSGPRAALTVKRAGWTRV